MMPFDFQIRCSPRREMLRSFVAGSLLMPGLLSQLLADGVADRLKGKEDPLSPKRPHFPAKANRVIFIFSNGGVSHMDTFDYKPELFKADGKMMVWEAGYRINNASY